MNRISAKMKLLEKFNGVSCPNCLSKDSLGFLGGAICRKYFCSECCVEFILRNGTMIMSLDLSVLVFEDDEYICEQ